MSIMLSVELYNRAIEKGWSPFSKVRMYSFDVDAEEDFALRYFSTKTLKAGTMAIAHEVGDAAQRPCWESALSVYRIHHQQTRWGECRVSHQAARSLPFI